MARSVQVAFPVSCTVATSCLRELLDGYTAEFAGCTHDAHFEKGSYLWRQGDAHPYCYLIESGQVALEIYVPAHGPIRVETLRPGDLLGGSAMLEPHRWSFDARSLTDVIATALDCNAVKSRAERNHEMGFHLYKRLAQVLDQRLTSARRRVLELTGVA